MTVLRLTGHPLQRSGARAVAVMAGVESVESLTESDLSRVCAEIADDAATAAKAVKGASGYGWFKALNNHFPNSIITQPKVGERQRKELSHSEIAQVVSHELTREHPDAVGGLCVFCDLPASAVWHKSMLPMVDGRDIVNNLPPGAPGWPICGGCRVALWALPYGCRVSASTSAVITAADLVEDAFVRSNVDYARDVIATGQSDIRHTALDGQRAALQALDSALAGAPLSVGSQPVTVWIYKNDNREPSLRVWRSDGSLPVLWRRISADSSVRAAWRLLEKYLAGSSGDLGVGKDRAARLMFIPPETERRFHADLVSTLFRAATVDKWLSVSRSLSFGPLLSAYLEVYPMSPIPDLDAVAVMIATHINESSNPRGAFNKFFSSLSRPGELTAWLMLTEKQALTRGQRFQVPPSFVDALFADFYRVKPLLFFAVGQNLNVDSLAGTEPDSEDEPDSDEHIVKDLTDGEEMEKIA